MRERSLLVGFFTLAVLAAIACSSPIPADFSDDIKRVGSIQKLKKILAELTQKKRDETLLLPKIHRFQENSPIQLNSDESIAREQDIIKKEENLMENLAYDVTKNKLNLLRKLKNILKRGDDFTRQEDAGPRPRCRCYALTRCVLDWRCKGISSDPSRSDGKAKEDQYNYKRSKLETLLDKITKLE